MKNYIDFLKSEIAKSTDSELVQYISNEIVLKNRNQGFQYIGSLTINYLFDIARTQFTEEVNNTVGALQSMSKPTSDIEVPVNLCFNYKTSIKQQSLKALIEFEKNFLKNIQTYNDIY